MRGAITSFYFLDTFIKPELPVWFLQLVLSGVEIYLCVVELRSVPAADTVVSSELPVYGVLVGLGLVPLGEEEHVLAVLVGKPGDGLLSVDGFIVSEWRQYTQNW